MAIVKEWTGKWVVWCHACKMGFTTIDEATQHDKENLNKHQLDHLKKREQNESGKLPVTR